MKFQIGDTVMHWSHGLGQIMAKEERVLVGESKLYYVVKIEQLDVWVPADGMLPSRLRLPTSAPAFKKLFAILSGPARTLPSDRRERKSQLHTSMAGGDAESICHVVRDLSALEDQKPLNDDDKMTLKRARGMLLKEWGYSLRIPPGQAEDDLHRLLKQTSLVAAA